MTTDNARLKEGAALAQSGQLGEALSIFEEVLRADPDHVDALFLKGACLYKREEFEDAAASWKRVLELQPDHPKARNMLAKIPQTSSWDSGGFGTPPQSAEPIATTKPTTRESPKRSPKKKGLNYKKIGSILFLLVIGGVGADMFLNPNSYPFLRKDRVELGWEWKSGEVLVYGGVIDQRVTIKGSAGEGGKPSPIPDITMGEKVTFDLKLTVREIDSAGVANIAGSYTKFGAQWDLPQFPGMGDAAGEMNRLMKGIFQKIEGKTFSLSIDSQGRVLRCSGMDEITAAAVASFEDAKTTPPTGEDPLKMLGNDATRINLQLLMGETPPSGVPIGGSWPGSLTGTTLPEIGANVQEIKYTLQAKEEVSGQECGRVSQSLAMNVDGNLDLPQMPFGDGVNFQMKGSSGTGTFLFSVPNRRLVRSESNLGTVVGMKMNLPPAMGGGSDGLSMEMKIDATYRLELKSTGSAASNVVESVQSTTPSTASSPSNETETSLSEGLAGKWFFLFEGSPSEFNFFPNGRLSVTVNREGGVTFNLDGSYKIEGDSIVLEVNTPDGPEEVTAYHAKIVGPNFTFNYDKPDGPEIRAERR